MIIYSPERQSAPEHVFHHLFIPNNFEWVGFLKKELEQVSYYLNLPLNIPLHIQIIILDADVFPELIFQ